MKHVRFFLLLSLFLAVAVPVMAHENDFPLDLRHHVDMPQFVISDNSDMSVFAIGYHFTLFSAWNRLAFGGLGTAIGADTRPGPDGSRDWDALYYLQIPVADLSLNKNGFNKDGDGAFEFSTAVLREMRYGSWGFRSLFTVGWQ